MYTASFKTHTSTRIISATSALNWVADSLRVARQRRALSKLSLSALDDIGATEAQANKEAHKPFWA